LGLAKKPPIRWRRASIASLDASRRSYAVKFIHQIDSPTGNNTFAGSVQEKAENSRRKEKMGKIEKRSNGNNWKQ
jgi:hypothetical protein